MLVQMPGYYSSRIPLLDHPALSGVTVAAAYGLRRLRQAYSGSAIRVRRSSDNTEQNIGFTGNALDTASLLSFVGAGNGFAAKWYDQSTAVRDLSTTIAAEQPRGVNAGSLETLNGQPTLRWLSSQLFFPAGFTQTLPTTVYAVVDMTNLAAETYLVFLDRTTATTSDLALYIAGPNQWRPLVYWNGNKAEWTSIIQRVAVVRWRLTASDTGVRIDNATEITAGAATTLENWASVGNAALQSIKDLPISELLMITSTVDAAADAAILADYNSRYGVY